MSRIMSRVSNGPPNKRGRIDPNQSLSAEEVEAELSRENPGRAQNKIVLLTVFNAHYPINVEVVHRICKTVGQVDRIVIFQKFYVQAMVEFHDLNSAVRAKEELHGCDIYSGCCTLKVDFAKTDKLNVKQNDDKTWDFTAEAEAMRGGMQQMPGDSSSNRRVLLEEKPPIGGGLGGGAMSQGRMTLFDTPTHQAGYQGGYGGGSNSGGGGGNNLSYNHYNNGGGGGGGGGRGGDHSRSGSQQSQSHGMWGGGYHHNQGGGGGGGGGTVLMIYQLDPERFNCVSVFNLLCQYGNINKVSFLKNKEGCAMVELGDYEAAERVLHNLNHVTLFNCKISIERSRKPFIEDIRKPHELPDGTESYRNFTGSRSNRFNTQERAAKNRIIPPTKVLHFYNVPKVDDDEMYSLFTEGGGPCPIKIQWFELKPGAKTVTGLVEFDEVSEACEALALVNHAKLPHGETSYEVKLCFSKAQQLAN